MTEVRKRRRSLTNVGGPVDTSGDTDSARALAHAIDVKPETDADAPDRAHVHGFHVYPARTHPVTARRLIEAFSAEDDRVLDPFCGSGTVLVEAMLAGREAVGTDLNPVAVRLATAKTYPRTEARIEALLTAAQGVVEFANARRKAKAGATRRLPREDVAIFVPHVLLELDGIRGGIEKAPPEHRPDLSLVLSSILVKMSAKRGDTSDEPLEKRIGAGYPSKLFLKKTEELGKRLTAFAAMLKTPPPRARVTLDDATVLKSVKPGSIHAVVTSPPYVATYDYLVHHEMRMRWLGLDARGLAKNELGARRHYERLSPRESVLAWERELADLFRSIARVTKKDGAVLLLIADSASARGPKGEASIALRADEIVAKVAEETRTLVPVARASQARPHFHGPTADAFRDRDRFEHALLLRRG